MKILVINCGSSSLKYQLIDMHNNDVLSSGVAERIGIENSFIKHATSSEKIRLEKDLKDHKQAVETILDILTQGEGKVIQSLSEISAVGHRAVHGGEMYSKSTLIDEQVIKTLEDLCELAPLHNPANIIGIRACQSLIPNVPHVAVFDTAFHQTMPQSSYIYSIPLEYYEKYKIRKYGFHGSSHRYVSQKVAQLLEKDVKDINVITCHLGNGASLCAIRKGISIDTTMGFTPLEGLTMGTRCGNIDPSIIDFIMKKENMTISQVMNILNKKSGLLGISGVSSDARDVEDAAFKQNNDRAKLALEKFSNVVKKHLGGYIALMDGVDAIVFTAGIGENSPETREIICKDLEHIGIIIDDEKNKVRGKIAQISSDDSKVKVFVIPTNEELMIAKDTMQIVNNL